MHTHGEAFYAWHGETCVLKLVGEVRYTLGADLDRFIDSAFAGGQCQEMLIDLTASASIDSTSLGLLAKIANLLRDKGHKATIVSTNPDIDRTLETVGFDQVFNVLHEDVASNCEDFSVPTASSSKDQMADVILRAHRVLCALNKENREMFQSVVDALETNDGSQLRH